MSVTISPNQASILTEAAQALQQHIRGQVILPADQDYEEIRRVWNGVINRRPAVIVQCLGASDVIVSVNFAREHGLDISVRGGGHNVAGYAVNDNGMMIDLSLMRGVRVNPQARSVQVQGGAIWSDVDRETQLFGLAVPNGHISTTGVAGLTLGGGYGHLRSKYGLTVDNLLSVDIVTADGRLLTASEQENSDLFWAVRGGGGNFGIVTSFEFRCHTIGTTIYRCAPFYPVEQAGDFIRHWRDFMASAPDEYTSNAIFWTIPDLPVFPEAARGRDVIGLLGVYCGDPEVGEKYTRPMRELGEAILDLSGAVPYLTAQTGWDPFFPHGNLNYYWKSSHLSDLTDEAIDVIVGMGAQKPTPNTLLLLWHFGGAVRRVEPTATAFWSRKVPFMLSFDATWSDPTDAEDCIRWSREGVQSMQRFSDGGSYLNFPGMGEEGDALVRAAYGGNYERLVAIKTKYDPTNLFHLNQNIKPAL
ncbi:MAG: FAD-binding oxidoreductase [Anaerolineae bacterium]|nr:FAD-binding oxidoreductase [Anaerolineae bacterium]